MVRTSTAATASWSNWVRRQNETPNETENQECGVARYQAGESIVILSVTVSRVCLGLSLFFSVSVSLSFSLSLYFFRLPTVRGRVVDCALSEPERSQGPSRCFSVDTPTFPTP